MIYLLALLLLPAGTGVLAAAVMRRRWRTALGMGAGLGAIGALLLTGVLGAPGGAIAGALEAFGSIALMLAALLTLVGMEIGHKVLQRKVPLR